MDQDSEPVERASRAQGAGGVGGPAGAVSRLPGPGAGRPGVPGAYGDAGRTATAHTTPAMPHWSIRETRWLPSSYAYPTYNAAMYSSYPNAWPATNTSNPSLYSNPGYGAVSSQLGMGQQPAPYDYGGNVVAQPNAVYVNGDNVGTPQQYAAQAGQIAAAGNAQRAEQPVATAGVFAVAPSGQTNPTGVLQLAVNSQGALRGNLHNPADNSLAPISDAVDPKTQRAAWTVGGSPAPVYEAGVRQPDSGPDDGESRQYCRWPATAVHPGPAPGTARGARIGGPLEHPHVLDAPKAADDPYLLSLQQC